VAPVVRGEIGGGAEAAGQEAAAEGAVGHEADSQLAAGGERARLVVAGEERVLALQRADRVDRLRPSQRGGGGLGEAEEAHLARADELAHGADRLLDRGLRVHPVLVVEVDRVDPEPLQARVARRADVLRPAVDSPGGRVAPAHDPELRGHHHARSTAPQRLAHQLLVRVRAVDVGGVEHRHAEVERAVDRGDRLGLVPGPVEVGHAQLRAHRPDLEPRVPAAACMGSSEKGARAAAPGPS
jgi:hypothetical protein